jgi:hypothetical protein
MPAILQQGCSIQCPHGGLANVVPTNFKVKVGGAPALLASDVFLVAGCPFMVGPKPQPCLTIEWQLPSTMFKINGQAVLLQTSIGICKSPEGVPQGVALISGAQTKASGL